MKKRVIAVLMAAAMAATLLAGCGNKAKDATGDGKDVSLEYVKDWRTDMKKRVIAVLMAAAMAATLLAGCGNKAKDATGDGKDVSLEYVKDKGSLVIGLDPAFPPMGFADENQEIVGFDIDLRWDLQMRIRKS